MLPKPRYKVDLIPTFQGYPRPPLESRLVEYRYGLFKEEGFLLFFKRWVQIASYRTWSEAAEAMDDAIGWCPYYSEWLEDKEIEDVIEKREVELNG